LRLSLSDGVLTTAAFLVVSHEWRDFSEQFVERSRAHLQMALKKRLVVLMKMLEEVMVEAKL